VLVAEELRSLRRVRDPQERAAPTKNLEGREGGRGMEVPC